MRLALSRHLRKWTYALVGREISRITRYADRVLHVDPLPSDTGFLLESIDAPLKQTSASETLAGAAPGSDAVDVILFNGNFNHSTDIQGLLETVRPSLGRRGRVVVALYNWYFAWLFRLADRLGMRQGPPLVTFITQADLEQLARLAGFELVRLRPVAYLPWHFFGLGTLLNVVMPAVPGLRWLSLVTVAVLRPIVAAGRERPSLSIVIPARNERGNIEDALRRMPDFGAATEVIYVEGHSSDGTWEEIQRVTSAWDGRNGLRVRAFQQVGKGKADAVRLGFSEATGDVLTILDADLTMPPERLTRFYDAYCEGSADFVNGTRLVYPMEGEAMRFLNRLGNVFFAKLLSFVLDVRLGDSLCGTKLVSRRDYERFVRWRGDFGDFDPFGDFELLFPAAVLGTGIIDIPVYYRARTYGTTNIRRFHDGAILFRMSMTGLLRISSGANGAQVHATSKVFVAGHRGLVGSAVVRRLEQDGVTPLTATRDELDLRDQAAVNYWFRANRPDTVYLVAGTVGGILANSTRPAEFIYDNLMIHATVVHACHLYGARKLLYLGSSCIYPREAPQPMTEAALLGGPLEPTNEFYAVAKIAGIKLCQAYRRQYGRNFISAMPTNLYGPNDNFDLTSSHVLPALIRKFHDAKLSGTADVSVWGSGRPRREFLHVDDLASACVFLMQNYDGEEHINVGTGEDLSINELAGMIRDVVYPQARIVFDASRPDGPPRKLLDVSRLRDLGWSPSLSLRAGIESTYQWFLRHQADARGLTEDLPRSEFRA